MAKSTIDQLIINPPYEEPKQYWSYDRETRLFALKDGRRPAGYLDKFLLRKQGRVNTGTVFQCRSSLWCDLVK